MRWALMNTAVALFAFLLMKNRELTCTGNLGFCRTVDGTFSTSHAFFSVQIDRECNELPCQFIGSIQYAVEAKTRYIVLVFTICNHLHKELDVAINLVVNALFKAPNQSDKGCEQAYIAGRASVLLVHYYFYIPGQQMLRQYSLRIGGVQPFCIKDKCRLFYVQRAHRINKSQQPFGGMSMVYWITNDKTVITVEVQIGWNVLN